MELRPAVGEGGGGRRLRPYPVCAAEAGPPGGDLHRHHPAGDSQGPGLPALRAKDPPRHQRSPACPLSWPPSLPGQGARWHVAGGAGGLGCGALAAPRSWPLPPAAAGRCRRHGLVHRAASRVRLPGEAPQRGLAGPRPRGGLRATCVLAWKAGTGRAPGGTLAWACLGRGGRAERAPQQVLPRAAVCGGAPPARV